MSDKQRLTCAHRCATLLLPAEILPAGRNTSVYEFDELGSYAAASVTVDGDTYYEVRHYGGGQVWRYSAPVEDGRPGPLREDSDGPVFTDRFDNPDREPCDPRQLRAYLMEWAWSDGLYDWRETLGNGPADMAAAMLGCVSATAGAIEHGRVEEAETCARWIFDDERDAASLWPTGIGFGAELTTHELRGGASIVWNLAGRKCPDCGTDPADTPYAETVLLVRDPVYVYGTLPLCHACAEQRADAYRTGGDGPEPWLADAEDLAHGKAARIRDEGGDR